MAWTRFWVSSPTEKHAELHVCHHSPKTTSRKRWRRSRHSPRTFGQLLLDSHSLCTFCCCGRRNTSANQAQPRNHLKPSMSQRSDSYRMPRNRLGVRAPLTGCKAKQVAHCPAQRTRVVRFQVAVPPVLHRGAEHPRRRPAAQHRQGPRVARPRDHRQEGHRATSPVPQAVPPKAPRDH